MKLNNINKISINLILVSIFLFSDFFTRKLISEEINNSPTEDYILRVPSNNFYILGPGDTISLKVSEESPELNQLITIDGEGTIFLSRLERIFVSGLTIKELTKILNKQYGNFVFNPDLTIIVKKYRPIKIYLDGEIQSPGIHVLAGSNGSEKDIENFNELEIVPSRSSNIENNVFFPSVIDALRKAGGITSYANLKNIKITRINSISDGGGRSIASVSLLDTLNFTDNSQNIRILDGDTIYVERNDEPAISQISKAIKSNINPKFINIGIFGRVNSPGTLKINKTATLNEAVALSGGTKFLKGPVNFVRYNNDGTVDSRKFKFQFSAKKGGYKNPYLRDGDVIYVGKSGLNIANEVITEITNPLQGIVSAYGFYKIIAD